MSYRNLKNVTQNVVQQMYQRESGGQKTDFGCYYSHPTIKYESFDEGSRRLLPCVLLYTAIQIL